MLLRSGQHWPIIVIALSLILGGGGQSRSSMEDESDFSVFNFETMSTTTTGSTAFDSSNTQDVFVTRQTTLADEDIDDFSIEETPTEETSSSDLANPFLRSTTPVTTQELNTIGEQVVTSTTTSTTSANVSRAILSSEDDTETAVASEKKSFLSRWKADLEQQVGGGVIDRCLCPCDALDRILEDEEASTTIQNKSELIMMTSTTMTSLTEDLNSTTITDDDNDASTVTTMESVESEAERAIVSDDDDTADDTQDNSREGEETRMGRDSFDERMMSNATNSTDPGQDLILQTFGRYFERIKTIYELDIKLLQQLSEILNEVGTDVLPGLIRDLEPILARLPVVNLPINELISIFAMTVQNSEFEASVSTQLGNLDFLDIGPISLPRDVTSTLADPLLLGRISNLIVAEFDRTGLGFPIQALILGPRAFSALTSRQASRHNDEMVTALVAGKLREFIEGSDTTIQVSNGEIVIDTSIQPMTLMNECKATVKAGRTRALATVQRSSTLRAAGAISAQDDQVQVAGFVGGDVDVSVHLDSSVRARLGKSLFGKCFTKFQNHLPVQAYSTLSLWIGSRIVTSNVRIEDRFTYSGVKQKYLVFNIKILLNAKIKSLRLDHLVIKGCDLKFLGIKVFSFCGLVQRTIRDFAQRFTFEFSEIHIPKLLRDIEHLLRTRVGDEVAIPLLLADEKQELVQTLFAKVENVAKLKGDLLQDLSGLAGQVSETLDSFG